MWIPRFSDEEPLRPTGPLVRQVLEMTKHKWHLADSERRLLGSKWPVSRIGVEEDDYVPTKALASDKPKPGATKVPRTPLINALRTVQLPSPRRWRHRFVLGLRSSSAGVVTGGGSSPEATQIREGCSARRILAVSRSLAVERRPVGRAT